MCGSDADAALAFTTGREPQPECWGACPGTVLRMHRRRKRVGHDARSRGFRRVLQLLQPALEVASNQPIHADERAHHLAQVGQRPVERPRDARARSFRFEIERGVVLRLERLLERQINRQVRRSVGPGDHHPALARFRIPFPGVLRTGAAIGAGVHPGQRRIEILPGRPEPPLPEILEQRKDLASRTIDHDMTLDAERVLAERRVHQDTDDEHAENQESVRQHDNLL